MKYLVITDIHGSNLYLEKVLEKESFDKLLLLGDILPHGPRNNIPSEYNPKKIIEILSKYKNKIICVRGNCDAEVDDMVLPFPVLSLACINDYNTNIYMTHGHKVSKYNLLNVDEGIVIYGHYHINEINKIDNVYYVNVGSISIPKDGHFSYGVIEDGYVKLKDVSGEIITEVKFNGKILL